ncbi:hypothetical protein Tco_0174276 [Tanacetum coccineum]
MSDVRCRTQLAAQTTRYWVKLPEPTKTVVSDQVSVPNVLLKLSLSAISDQISVTELSLNKVEKPLGTPIEVEPLDETQLEDLGLNTCNHDITLSSRKVPSFDKMKPQPQPLPTYPPLDISLGDKRGLEPPIKPHSPNIFRMKEVDHLTNNTLPSPYVSSFHPKDTYCHYHPCIGDPKKHYGFKTGLLRLSGSLVVDFLKLGMIKDDWELESKKVSFLGRGLNSPVRPKEVENARIKETHRLEHKIQQILFQHMAPSRHHGRKAHLLEDKKILSVGVFDEVKSGHPKSESQTEEKFELDVMAPPPLQRTFPEMVIVTSTNNLEVKFIDALVESQGRDMKFLRGETSRNVEEK